MDLLPTEICAKVLSELPLTEAGVCALARCSMTGHSTLRTASLDHALWKPHYKRRYVHAQRGAEEERRGRFGEDWRRLYYERRRLDQEALENLSLIEASMHSSRIELARRTVEMGFDIWDCLSGEAARPPPPLFHEEEDLTKVIAGSPLTSLARRYWASELSMIISRRNAITQWYSVGHAVAHRENSPLSFEEVFALLSSFHGILPDEIINHLDREGEQCRSYLEREHIPYVLGTAGFDIEEVCIAICAYMRSQGYERVHDNDFRDLHNSLPHVFLTTARRTLPLSLVFIYVGIVRRLGLEASALNTPGTVTALIHDTAVDVAHSHLHPILDRVDHEQVKHMFGISYQTGLTYQLLLRAAANIEHGRILLLDPRAGSTTSVIDDSEIQNYFTGIKALYMGHVISCLSGVERGNDSGSLAIALKSGLFPLDRELVVRDKLLGESLDPLSSRAISRHFGEEVLSASDIDEGSQSSTEVNTVETADEFFVGQLVLSIGPSGHHSVIRCIIGCKLDCGQIICQTIDHFSIRIISFRFEGIKPVERCTVDDIRGFRRNPMLGRFFDDAEFVETNSAGLDGRGRFLMNKRLMKQYPLHDRRGERWVRPD